MRVLIVTPYYLPGFKAGGPIRSLANLVDELGDSIDFHVIAGDRDLSDDRPYPNIPPDSWQQVGKGRVLYTAIHATKLKRLSNWIRESQADVLYLNSVFNPLVCSVPLAMWRLNLIPRLPLIIAPRGGFSPAAMAIKHWKKLPYLRLVKSLASAGPVVWHATSELEREDIVRNIGPRARVFVAPNLCLANERPDNRNPKIAGQLRLAYVSRITPKKSLRGAIDSLRHITGQVEFDVFGPIEDTGYWKQCKIHASALPSNIRVRYRGMIEPAHVGAVLSEYDAMLLPTLGENFGHAIIESLSAGCPVVISDRTPWRNLQSFGVGWDLPLESPAAFEHAIADLVAMDEATHRPMRDNARKFSRRARLDQDAVIQTQRLFQLAAMMVDGTSKRTRRRAA